jgi:hypothetical protein
VCRAREQGIVWPNSPRAERGAERIQKTILHVEGFKKTSLAAAKIQIERIGSIEMEKGLMYRYAFTSMYTLFSKIKPKTLVPVSFPYSQQQPRYGLWCASDIFILLMRIVLSLVYRWRLERPPALIIHGLCA